MYKHTKPMQTVEGSKSIRFIHGLEGRHQCSRFGYRSCDVHMRLDLPEVPKEPTWTPGPWTRPTKFGRSHPAVIMVQNSTGGSVCNFASASDASVQGVAQHEEIASMDNFRMPQLPASTAGPHRSSDRGIRSEAAKSMTVTISASGCTGTVS
jgi:hypothetical protein